MPLSERYEILETIASGDFATVYRGRDHELGRDVAVKQIHQQYLADPRQLDRYWQEAQLLASLQHPHIMTIYDLVRERGWLILELMNGSLSQLLGGRPIDLKDLRLTLNYTLQALQAMHRCGILHGDIKPSNLLVDRNQRVKLGDFGIARHITGEGSVVKGTTKYIAPEVVSDQFGPVGPHSDLYSLGFTAYELMCGEHFESLFPGLNMYGRDRMMAWMMWHSAADRRLPEVSRVLDGVPADLAHIIQKLTEKIPAKRYRTTDQVLADLKLDGQPPTPEATEDEQAAAESKERQSRRKRSLAIGAAACSIVLSIGMLFLPTGAAPEKPPPKPPASPTDGDVVEVDRERGRLFVKPSDGEAQAIVVREGRDRVFLNGQQVPLDQLDLQDHVQIATSTREGQEFLMIEATRAAAEEFHGPVLTIDSSAKLLTVASTVPETGEKRFSVGEHVPVEINGETKRDGRSLGLADLLPNDNVMVRYKSAEDKAEAALVKATRRLTSKGFVDEISERQLKLRLADAWNASDATERIWPLAESCEVTVNGQSTQDGRALTIADLRQRDAVTIEFDIAVHRIAALRDTEIAGVIESIDRTQRTITLKDKEGESSSWTATPNTQITIAGTELTSEFNAIRTGDSVTLHLKSPDPTVREAAAIMVTPKPDPRAWAFVMEQNEYDNPRLPRPPFVSEDATELHATLRFRYRIPESQCLRERNATRLKLETALGAFLGRVPPDSQAIVFCLGLGFMDSSGRGYFAPQGFDEQRADATGIGVRWLIDQMEKCRATDKLLVLDTSRDTGQPQRGGFTSAAELAETARPGKRRPLSATVAVLANCSAGEVGYPMPNQQRGAFINAVVAALGGQADADNDSRVSSKELAAFVSPHVSKLLGTTKPQTPAVFWPDPKPPRLSAEAQTAVLRLFDHFSRTQDVAKPDFEEAAKLCAGQPDAHLVYALLLLKYDNSPLANQVLDQVRIAHPNIPPTHEMLAWLTFRRGELKQGVTQLERLVRALPQSNEPSDQEYAIHAASFAGRMTGFGMFVAVPARRLTNTDVVGLAAALKLRPEPVQSAFRESYRLMEQAPRELDQRIADTANPTEKSRLEQQRSNFNFHVPFDYEAVQRYLRAGLDR
jgi:serine/threonine protein kinase